MKRFNKNAALNKLSNKNNSKTKKRTIIISVMVLVIGILYFSFARFESTASFNLISGTANIQRVTLVEKMIDLKTNGATDLEYDGVESLGEYGTEDNNLRYIGATPNNYVYFNCSTTNPLEMNDSTCEKWRIIGLFNNIEDNNGNVASRIKIVRDEPLGRYSWDSSESSINNGGGINQWGPSGTYEGADLMRELNTDYLGNITVGTDGKWFNSINDLKEREYYDELYVGTMPNSSLNLNAQKMIETIYWNIGTLISTNYNNKNLYDEERSDNISGSLESVNDHVIRTTSWIGKVALMYASDFGYSTSGGVETTKEMCLDHRPTDWCSYCHDDECAINAWLYSGEGIDWLLTPNKVGGVLMSGNEGNTYGSPSNFYNVRPAIFLKNDILIVYGNGSKTNPYKIVII